MRFAAVLLLLALRVHAAELELPYTVLERIAAAQLFTADGRHYVRGNTTSRCQFAYLENPHIYADNGRLRVTARFTGRSAMDLFDRCLGIGDSFDLSMTASPFPNAGAIVLRDVEIAAARDSYYIRGVRAALARSIAKDFKIDVHDHARALLAPTGELASFDLSEIRVTPSALVLVVDFKLVVK